MPFNCDPNRCDVKKHYCEFFVFAVIMSFLVTGFVALVMYVSAIQNQEMHYSMAEPSAEKQNSLIFPFGPQLEISVIESKNATLKKNRNLHKCEKGYFSCSKSTNVCLPLSRRCNDIVDCPNAEDEQKCVCAFRMPLARFCDKYPDCFDESDENFCNYCPPNSFNCANGQCIPRNKVCDFKVDCQNAMDESFCFKLSSNVAIASVDNEENRKLSKGTAETTSKTGFLLRNQNGIWYPVCANPYDAMQDALASHACVSITANPLVSSSHQQRTFQELLKSDYVYHFSGRFVHWSGCLTLEGIFVTCDDVLCGFNPRLMLPKPQGRIVGGSSSDAGAWPWHAAIYKNGTYVCGATLINNYWLLSAAHCFLNYQFNYYEVQLGMLRRRSFTPHQKTYRIERVVVHHKFHPITLNYDIALLKTSQSVSFDFWVRPICLPDPNKMENVGSFCTAIGWGDTGEKEQDSDDLREVHIPLMASCKNSDRWICAGFPEGGKDACQGDSGGPLMCLREDRLSWYIAGVISSGTGCARPKSPGIYTRVAYFNRWITMVMNSKSKPIHPIERPLSGCPGWTCQAVGGGNCLTPSRLCDGHVDCYDAEDEVNCLNGKKRKNKKL